MRWRSAEAHSTKAEALVESDWRSHAVLWECSKLMIGGILGESAVLSVVVEELTEAASLESASLMSSRSLSIDRFNSVMLSSVGSREPSC